jgi:hypothetical protein
VGQKGVKDAVGLNNIGLLIRAFGRVESVDSGKRRFVIDDGSDRGITCAAPADTGFTLPSQNEKVTVTGISSCEISLSGDLVSLIRIRCQDDVN